MPVLGRYLADSEKMYRGKTIEDVALSVMTDSDLTG